MKKILGIKVDINQVARTITLPQEAYNDLMLHQFSLFNANAVATPVTKDIKSLPMCSDNEEPPTVPYTQLVGSLMYAAMGSHPDIAFSVHQLSQFNQKICSGSLDSS